MENMNNDFRGKFRRGAVRIGLEVIQGLNAQNASSDADLETVPENIEESLNNPYVNRHGIPLAMDIFKPTGPEYDGKELPVIVAVHGGGLVSGDRKISLQLSRDLAQRGYLVFAIEYRLAPRATVCEEFDDICAGLDFVGKKLVEYDVDFTRMFMTADSAGAFLAIYTAAMKKSKKLQDAIGYEPSRMSFKALGLSCGMYYTNRDDVLGYLLSEQFYGDKRDDPNFLQYMNPEHPEIINNLPPTFLVTARGDFLNKYTIMYEEALKKAGKTTKMLYYAEDDLIHTFNFCNPELPQSKDANDKMLAFFEMQADIAREKSKRDRETEKELNAIEGKIKDKTFEKQKLWQTVRALNTVDDSRLERVAIIDDSRKLNYRQMFRKWDNYAEVFSALNMTETNRTRAAMPGVMTTEGIIAFYALNMTGASVSLMPYCFMQDEKKMIDAIKDEGITDLILTDYETEPGFLKSILLKREELALRNIIILKTRVTGPCVTEKDKSEAANSRKEIRKLKGVFFMEDLLEEYEATPIQYAGSGENKSAVILHKHVDGANEFMAVNFSDIEINSISLSSREEASKKSKGGILSGLTLDLFTTHSLVDQVQMPFFMGNTVVVTFKAGYNKNFYKAIEAYHINSITAYSSLFEDWMKRLKDVKFNLTSLDNVYVAGSGITDYERNQYKTFCKERSGIFTEVEEGNRKLKDYSDSITYDVNGRKKENPAPCMMPMMPYLPGMIPIANAGAQFRNHPAMRAQTMPMLVRVPVLPGFPPIPVPGMPKPEVTGMQKIMNKMIPALVSIMSEAKNKTAPQDEEKQKNTGAPSTEYMKILAALFDSTDTEYYYEN